MLFFAKLLAFRREPSGFRKVLQGFKWLPFSILAPLAP